MPMQIDAARFLASVAKRGGQAVKAPADLEELFTNIDDPDEFGRDVMVQLLAAKDACEREHTALSDDPLIDSITIFPGDLVVKSDFTFNSHVVVLGDLIVEGTITIDFEHAILMVAGDVKCHAMYCMRAYVFITGWLRVATCFYGCTYGFSKIAATVSTPIFLYDETWAVHQIDSDFDDPCDLSNIDAVVVNVDTDDIAKLKEHVPPELLTEPFDAHRLFVALASEAA